MTEAKTSHRKWKDWNCGNDGCFRSKMIEKSRAKQSRGSSRKTPVRTPKLPTAARRRQPNPKVAIEVWIRDKGRCVYCPKALEPYTLTFDHIIPVCYGGRAHVWNLVLACGPCNRRRGTAPAPGWLLRKMEKIYGKDYSHPRPSPAETPRSCEVVASVRTRGRQARQGSGGRTRQTRGGS